MTNSKDKTPTTCLSSVLRRLLCTGGLPTHPSSDTDNPVGSTRLLSKTDSSTKHQPSSPTRSTIPAGIVARLMGLDPIPNQSHATIMRKSRSVGSVDFLPNFDRIPKQSHHHRARTSVSFREVPTFLQTSSNHVHGNGNFDHVRKSEMGLTPIEEKSRNLNKKKNVKNDQKQSLKMKSEERVSSVQVNKCRRKNDAKKKVIDDGFPEEQKKKCKSRKKMYNHPLPKMGKHDRKAKKKVMLKRRDCEYSEEYCIKVLMDVCRLTTDEMKESVWVVNNLQDISYEIAQEILHMLVYEMIDELCRFP